MRIYIINYIYSSGRMSYTLTKKKKKNPISNFKTFDNAGNTKIVVIMSLLQLF